MLSKMNFSGKKFQTPFGFNIENFLYSENQGFSDYSFLINLGDKTEHE